MFIIYLLIPAIIGVSEYGHFSFALSLCFIFSQPFIEFGLDPLVTKYASRGDDIIKDAFILRAMTSFIGFIVLMISAVVFKAKLDLTIIIFLYLLFFSFSNLVFAYLRGKERFIYESVLLPLFRGCIIILILYFAKVLLIENRYTGAVPFSISSFVLFISSLVILFKIYNKSIINKGGKKKLDISILKEGSFLFFSTVLWMIYFRIDSVMLGFMIGETEVGIYSLSYRLYEGTIFMATSVMIVIFPKLSSYGYDDLKRIFMRGFFLLSGISILIFIGLFFVGELVIESFYSSEFSRSIGILKIISFSVLAVFPAHLTTQFLIARDRNHLFLLITAMGALLNIVLNLLLIPTMRSSGAAIATLATEVLILLLSLGLSAWIIKRRL